MLIDKTNQTFAKRFKELRLQRGYTQQELANLFNVTRPCICYWETGKRLPEYKMLIDLCIFFDVETDYLLGVLDSKKSTFNEGKIVYNFEDYLDMSPLSEEFRRQLKEYYAYLLDKQEKITANKGNLNF